MNRLVPVTFRCPYCGYGFVRNCRKLEGSTSCPKCLKRFPRVQGRVLDDEALAVRKERAAHRLDRNRRIYLPIPEPATSETIRSEQVPISRAEARFKARAVAKGWKPHRPSWPDFLVEFEGKVIAVEVKAGNDELSSTQVRSFSLIEAAGLPVFIWKDQKTTRATLVRWAKGEALKRLTKWAKKTVGSNSGGDT